MELEAIPKTRVDDEVYGRLLSNIHDGVWKSGEKLPSENALCQLLSVSRVSVRSAIQRLRALGLVETKHGKGTYVNCNDQTDFSKMDQVLDLTQKEFTELNDLREAIEPKAIQLIMGMKDSVDLTPIQKAYYAMKTALNEGNAEEYTRQDFLFHMGIINASGNDLFIQIASIFRSQYFKYFREMNKFIFEDNHDAEALMQWCKGQNDSHTLLYNYLTGDLSENIYELMNAFTSGNRSRFESYQARMFGHSDIPPAKEP